MREAWRSDWAQNGVLFLTMIVILARLVHRKGWPIPTTILAVVIAIFALNGCSQYVDVEPSDADRENREIVLQYLESVNEADFLEAFEALSTRPFTRRVVTLQLDESGTELARDERIVEQTLSDTGLSVDILSESEAESFDFGLFSGIFAGAAGGPESNLFKPVHFPEDRGYNNPRHENKYLYRFGSDEIINGRSTRTVHITVLDNARDEVFVQGMYVEIDVESAHVLSLLMDVRVKNLLYSEESSIELRGIWTEDEQFQPAGFTLTTQMKSALSDPVFLQIDTQFSFPE